MDYEKKYKEALEKAKNMINDLRKGEDILAVSELETMFPELVESEDEKVRKAIIELLNTTIKGKKVYSIADTTRSEMIAWLENIPYTIDHEKREGFRLGYKAGLEKQGDKPAWSEEDEVRLQACLDTLQAKSLFGVVDTKMTEWLKSLKDRYTWRPSDEQIKALKYVAYHLMPDTNYRKEMFSLYEDLKKLK